MALAGAAIAVGGGERRPFLARHLFNDPLRELSVERRLLEPELQHRFAERVNAFRPHVAAVCV